MKALGFALGNVGLFFLEAAGLPDAVHKVSFDI